MTVALLAVPVVMFVAAVAQLAAAERSGMIKRGPLAGVVSWVVLAVPTFVVPQILRRGVRRNVSRLFDERTQAALLAFCDVKKWGILCHATFVRKFDRHDDCVQLRELRSLGVSTSHTAPLAPRRSRLRWVVGGVVLLAIAAFVIGESRRQSPSEMLAAEYEARFANLQQRFAAAIAKLPPVGKVEDRAPAAPLDPKPDSHNTLFVSVDAINRAGPPATVVSDSEAWRAEPEEDATKRFPDARLGEDESDLVFRWRPEVHGAFHGTDDTVRPRYEDVLDTRYAVAVRIPEWIVPVRQEGVGLVAGAARVEVFLIDLKTGELLGSLAKSVTQDATVIFHRGDPLQAAAENLANNVGTTIRAAVATMVDSRFEKCDLRFWPPIPVGSD
jgi:hypothetical protein